MKIRLLFLLGFAAAGLPGALLSLDAASHAWTALRQARVAVANAGAMGVVMQLGEAVTLQRGTLLQVAAGDAKAQPKLADQVAAQERLAESAAATMRQSGSDPAPLEKLMQRMADLRAAVHAGKPGDPAIAERILGTVTEVAGRVIDESRKLEQDVQRADPGLGQRANLAEISVAMREAAGRRSALHSNFLSGLKLAPAEADELLTDAGQLQALRQRAENQVVLLGNPPRLVAAMESLSSGFFAKDEPRYGAVTAAIRGVTPPPLDFAAYRGWTQGALAGLLTLRDAAIGEAVAQGEAEAAQAWHGLIENAAILAAILLLGLYALVVLMHRVVHPLGGLTRAVGAIAEGQLDIVIPAGRGAGEIAAMSARIGTLRDRAAAAKLVEAQLSEEQARQMQSATTMTMRAMQFEVAARGALGGVRTAARTLTDVSDGLRQQSASADTAAADIASGAGAARAGIDALTAGSAQLASSSTEIARRMEQTSGQVSRTAVQARSAARDVHALAEAAGRIRSVVTLIDEIAARTNLLALNATIEAARAGAAGRGFAVVAGEVKALAAQTAKATGEITAQIAAIQSGTELSVQNIADIAAEVDTMATTAVAVAAAVEQQDKATRNMADAVARAAANTEAVSAVAGRVKDSSSATRAEADHMVTATGSMQRELESLTGAIEEFLSGLRQAA